MGIYVETLIRGSLDEVWQKTQTPDLHQRWDVRFTNIEYLPRPNNAEPQRFLYATRIGFGIEVRGVGETVGTQHDERQRTSALKFWSDDRKSLIKEGSGYWKYQQQADGVRFLTWYDYQTRFGVVGHLFDRLVFRPLLGWGTAWSFDRLRLWIERGVDPAVSMRASLIHALARFGLATIWIYQGLVPKLLALHADERAMMMAAGVPDDTLALAVRLSGIAEIVFGVLILLTWRRRVVFLLNVALMILATVGVLLTAPQYFAAAFNPFTLNVSVIFLALIGFIASFDMPSASRCLRQEKKP